MAGRKASGQAVVPFYRYLWQFYEQNRKRMRAGYAPLTRKFLDFNDPEKGADAFLRPPQFEALEMYVFLTRLSTFDLPADFFHAGKFHDSRLSRPFGRIAFRNGV